MASSGTERAVIATFDSSAQAEQAANDLMDWEKTNPDISLDAIGVLTKNDKGEIKAKSYGARNTGRGAKVGMGIGVLAAVVSGGLTLIPTAIGGAIAGAAAGSLSRKGLGLTDTEEKRLSSDLGRGCAAILVMCNDSEVKAITDYLMLEGGRTLSHPIDSASLESAPGSADSEPAKPSDSKTSTA
jgi:uncharacterized membrane protein